MPKNKEVEPEVEATEAAVEETPDVFSTVPGPSAHADPNGGATGEEAEAEAEVEEEAEPKAKAEHTIQREPADG